MNIEWTNCSDRMPRFKAGDELIINEIGTSKLFKLEIREAIDSLNRRLQMIAEDSK